MGRREPGGRQRRSGRAYSFVIVVMVACAALTVFADAAGKPVSHYTGHLIGDARGQSELKVLVTERNGKPRTATFSAKGILFGCDDGSKLRANYNSLRYRFVNGSRFYGDSNFIEDDEIELLVLKGRLREHQTEIRGYVLAIKDREPGMPDCATFGRETWRAERVDG